jgi:phosphatidylglycerol:prolipoprotein diacylglycerol transferase
MPWGVLFVGKKVPVHPTQLYDAACAATLGLVLLWRFGRRKFDGENIALLLLTYPVLRSITEAFRGDPERGSVGPFSTSQLLSVPLLMIGIILYVRLSRRPASVLEVAPRPSPTPPPLVSG